MRDDLEDANVIYKVVINDEDQYSLWPAQQVTPLGWRDVGESGTQTACLAYISQIWTDMRPLRIRNQLKALNRPQES